MAEERVHRRLAAILAADVVGYTSLIEQDEAGTLALLKSRRKEILVPLVAKHQGRVFKTNGDGVLVEFGSAVDAVQCAIDLQHGKSTANNQCAEEHRIVLRIGINLGDAMVEGGDLYGDGVNIAARLDFLGATGNAEAAIEQIDLAKRLNPFDTRWVPWIRGIHCFTARRYDQAIAMLKQVRDPINEVRGWLAASYAHAGRLQEARSTLEEFLRVAEFDMASFAGRRLKDWEPYWHGAFEYRDQKDFDHLFDALRKAGLPD